ncbi:MAG: AarF/ABC1/UbiB kinase family protein [Clostridiales bacterium]|nr:AarF/ABC1/UbiB kinase family protein [Eubacteriales bacterium]MDH7567147.1 AarF/ABC1/UbiB kinase family protein [Clostridiales bacterium]
MKKKRERVKEIVAVFIKHGVKDGIRNINNPSQIREALEELGPTFVKIGQILSTRPDMLPESYIQEFQKLQDDVTPENFDVIKGIVEKELNGAIEDLFLTFDRQPIASASLAEVHTATLKSGEKVAVKIQRPGVREVMMTDIAILKRLAGIIKYTPQGSVLNPKEVVEELWLSLKKELDFLNEAENIKRFYEYNQDVKSITCPKVFDEYTTSNILVMDFIDGIKIDNIELLSSQGYDLKDIVLKLSNNYFKQVFEDGFFHADPHPGNIMIKDNKIAYIDFGMIGTLSKPIRDKLGTFFFSMATRDMDAMTQSVLKIGIKKGSIDVKRLYSDIEEIYNKYIEASLYDINLTQLLDEIFKASRRNNLVMPKDITLLSKGIMTLEGVIAKIYPEINIMDVAVPYAKAMVLKKSDYKQDIVEQLENLYTLSKSGLKIPLKLLELINSALSGKLKIQLEHIYLEKSVGELNKMVNRMVFGIIVSSLIIGSSLVIRLETGPKMFDISVFGMVGYIAAVIIGLWLLISIFRSGRM